MLDRLAEKSAEIEKILPEQMHEADRRQGTAAVIRVDVGERIGRRKNIVERRCYLHRK
ncbi:MAG TPA: hypothetical protein VJR49_03585 [Chthoniobacterales bacterium]|nr:hypothetical protein [Chthoniobacterales bacterium]